MTTISYRPFAGDVDFQLIAELLNACEAVDTKGEFYTADDLRREFSTPGFDPVERLRLWHNAEQQLIAFGQLWADVADERLDGFLWYRVHPEARGAELDDEILAWGEGALRDACRRQGLPGDLRCGGRDDQTERFARLEQRGYQVARYWWKMSRSLLEPIPEPVLPDGIVIRHVTGTDEAAEWVACFNESFIDHYNHHMLPVEEHLHTMASKNYRPEYDLVAVTPEGKFAAFDLCEIRLEENEQTGLKEGWISKLGVRRGYRRVGLGRAMLLAGLKLLKEQGLDTAMLMVDAASPTNANRLYESAGFSVATVHVTYIKTIA